MPQAIYHGHSCVELHGGGKKLIVDPFLTHNPKADVTADQITVDYILVTHGHDDHVGDTVAMAKRCDATVICNFDLGMIFYQEGLKVHMMHIGGAHDFAFGRVKLTIAHHGSGYGMEILRYAGPPTGMLITLEGKTVYHAGDTGLFYDMKLIGERHPIDLAFLPIGDNFTMGIEDAAVAVEFLKPKQVVPIHYATEEMIDVDPEKFRALVKGAKTVIMKPGETLEF